MTTPDQRTCPGEHSPDRPAPTLRPDEYLCRSCVGRTMGRLEGLSVLLAELEVTTARQSVVRMGGTAGRRRRSGDGDQVIEEAPAGLARELPVVFNEAAARVRADVEQRLIEWAEHVAAVLGIDLTRVPADPYVVDTGHADRFDTNDVPRCVHEMPAGTCSVCGGLPHSAAEIDVFVSAPRPRVTRRRASPPRVAAALAVLRSRRARNWYRINEQGPECAYAIGYVTRLVRSTIDRYDRRWYAGECGQPITVVDLVDDEAGTLHAVTREDVCRADLYAEPGAGIVVCDGYREPGGIGGCGALHPAVTRHRYVLAKFRTQQLPLDALLSVVPTLIGGTVPEADTLRQWRHRGRLRPLVCLTKHATDRDAAACRLCRREMYLGGQVLDLILASRQRPRRSDTSVEN